MHYDDELKFEADVIQKLVQHGWKDGILRYPTEQDLIDNWAKILYQNNKDVDTLNSQPLTDTEMQQFIEKINELQTPLRLNGFINGKSVRIKRDNKADKLHYGKEVDLHIYDRNEIAAGSSTYQIAEQPKFEAEDDILPDRRGDFMLLINGMPVFHVELKKSGIAVQVACNQIQTYSHEGVFSKGIFALVQVFAAMTPEDMVYFANPGQEGEFNDRFFFHWADINNKAYHRWEDVTEHFFNIPLAHQMIGFYTVADKKDGVLKVMRSYQYYASSFIWARVAGREDWTHADMYGGHIWHTTGSGKTMTSFKAAQLIASQQVADKVVFLVDRVDLATQSIAEYQSFADDETDVQDTKNTGKLISRLKSTKPADTLIVTSIQKMSNVKRGNVRNELDIDTIGAKKLVFIVDECHRSTFGEMMTDIKNTFPCAMFFGFTGTPIFKANQRKGHTTASLFGDPLHSYSIACGINDGNVLGFDPYLVPTFKDKDLRKSVALKAANVATEEDVWGDPEREEIYQKVMDKPMASKYDDDDHLVEKGIEDFVPVEQYQQDKHRKSVVKDIKENWATYSVGNKFHALFATSGIKEAIAYYRLLKEEFPKLRITAIFDPHDDFNDPKNFEKIDGLKEILFDYNTRFDQSFTLKSDSYDLFRKDVCNRLAHKEPYQYINPEDMIDMVVVVNQLLTGFDSKWINTLYLDKKLEYQDLIQAMSRTNRLNCPEKRHGIIRFYRYPHTMKVNMDRALKLYSGDEPLEIFVNKLPQNIASMNSVFVAIQMLFQNAHIENFEKLPGAEEDCAQFAKLFKNLQGYLDSAKLQGFVWEKQEYPKDDETVETIKLLFDNSIYTALLQRYKELRGTGGDGGGTKKTSFPIDSYITEIRTDAIDRDYMNGRFKNFMNTFNTEGLNAPGTRQALEDLHKTFAQLTSVEQKYANLLIAEIQKGRKIEDGKSFRDLIVEMQNKAENDQIHIISKALGVDEELLRMLVNRNVNEKTINEQNKYNELKKSADNKRVHECMECLEKQKMLPYEATIKMDKLLRQFLFAEDAEREEIARRIATEYIRVNPAFREEMEIADPIISVSGGIRVYPTEYDKEPSYSMVADTTDINSLSEETLEEILKKSLESLFRVSDYKGKKLFIRAEQWIGVYRDCVELGFSIENDYRGFVDQVNRLKIAEVPVACTVAVLEKYDTGVFRKPQEEWTFESYKIENKGRYEKTFKDLHSAATHFHKILYGNIPQKRVIANPGTTMNFNAPVGNVIGNIEQMDSKIMKDNE